MPLNNRITHQRWQECADCGTDYPIGDMVRQNGVLVSIDTCVDVRDHPGESKTEPTAHDELRLPDAFAIWW